MKFNRCAALPKILALPVALLGGAALMLFALSALIPGVADAEFIRLGITFFIFITTFLFIAVPLMCLILRRSKHNLVIFTDESVVLEDETFLLNKVTIYYHSVTLQNFLKGCPGTMRLHDHNDPTEVFIPGPRTGVEIGTFTRRDVMRIAKLGVEIQIV